MAEKPKAPGLRWRSGGAPLWRASKAAIRAGYPVKSVNLAFAAAEPERLIGRCNRLQAEMLAWMSGRAAGAPEFDGTVRALLDVYQRDPESPYRKLKPSSRHPYDVYARLLIADVGTRRIDAIDGRDLRRWFAAWSAPDRDGPPKLAAARMAITVFKAALSFGKTCRLRGCADLKSIVDDIEFPLPPHRTEAPTAADVARARRIARDLGHQPAALAYAMQFETTLRQWDVIGEWVPIADPRPSAVIDGKTKWIGPTWAMIDEMVLTVLPSKTIGTTQARVAIDLRACQMVMEEFSEIPADRRKGPLIVNPKTGLPYRHEYWRKLWREVAKAGGIAATVWNRDLRAGGITEARKAGASTDDVARTAGHNKRTTARVYDRDTIEAARRVALARAAHRAKNES